jgi:peptidoglycan/LPS O-acetylase OafA/YrhL
VTGTLTEPANASAPAPTPPPIPPRRAGIGHVAAFDGLRAVALAAVLLYHAGVGGVPGSFLGLDVFFVLSGYLITGLLAREFLATGRLDLRRFYVRRARRLLPSLVTVLAVTCVAVVVWLPNEAAAFRSDLAASAIYVTNWWFVVKGQSYFGGTGRPSLLLHLWSLAVEEQFYLLWPVSFVVMIGRSVLPEERIRALWRAVGWATLFALLSAGLTAALYSPWHDPSRIYYGTDTRAFELFAGVLLALVQIARTPRDAVSFGWVTQVTRVTRVARVARVAGLARITRTTRTTWAAQAARTASREAPAFFAFAALLLMFVTVPATTPVLYPGVQIATSIAAVLLIRGLAAGCAIGDLFARRPLVWMGERSYAIYLWHWPIFTVTRPGDDVTWPSPVVFAVRILLSMLLAELTYRFVERPIRGGALGRTVRGSADALKAREFGLPALAGGTTLVVVAATLWLAGSLNTTVAAHPVDDRAVAVDSGPAAALTSTTSGTPNHATPHGAMPHSARPTHPQQPTTQPSMTGQASTAASFPAEMPAVPAHPPRVAVIGDSQGMTLFLNRPPDTAAYLTLFDDSTEGCGLLGGRILSRSGERRDLDAECGKPAVKWAARAGRDQADIALMMIGAWDLFDEQVGGTALAFGTPAWDGYFNSRLAEAVGELHAAGVPRVALALLPCYRPFHSSAGTWPERGDDQRVQHVNALLTGFAATPANHAEPLFPPAGFCEDPAISVSRAYRWDGVHYYKPGARLFLRTAIPQLLAGR